MGQQESRGGGVGGRHHDYKRAQSFDGQHQPGPSGDGSSNKGTLTKNKRGKMDKLFKRTHSIDVSNKKDKHDKEGGDSGGGTLGLRGKFTKKRTPKAEKKGAKHSQSDLLDTTVSSMGSTSRHSASSRELDRDSVHSRASHESGGSAIVGQGALVGAPGYSSSPVEISHMSNVNDNVFDKSSSVSSQVSDGIKINIDNTTHASVSPGNVSAHIPTHVSSSPKPKQLESFLNKHAEANGETLPTKENQLLKAPIVPQESTTLSPLDEEKVICDTYVNPLAVDSEGNSLSSYPDDAKSEPEITGARDILIKKMGNASDKGRTMLKAVTETSPDGNSVPTYVQQCEDIFGDENDEKEEIDSIINQLDKFHVSEKNEKVTKSEETAKDDKTNFVIASHKPILSFSYSQPKKPFTTNHDEIQDRKNDSNLLDKEIGRVGGEEKEIDTVEIEDIGVSLTEDESVIDEDKTGVTNGEICIDDYKIQPNNSQKSRSVDDVNIERKASPTFNKHVSLSGLEESHQSSTEQSPNLKRKKDEDSDVEFTQTESVESQVQSEGLSPTEYKLPPFPPAHSVSVDSGLESATVRKKLFATNVSDANFEFAKQKNSYNDYSSTEVSPDPAKFAYDSSTDDVFGQRAHQILSATRSLDTSSRDSSEKQSDHSSYGNRKKKRPRYFSDLGFSDTSPDKDARLLPQIRKTISSASLESTVIKPKTVPVPLDFKQLEKFEGIIGRSH